MTNLSDSLQAYPATAYEGSAEAVADLLDKGVIQRSGSPYASPTVLVRKKDWSIRLCIDYRKLNAITLRDTFPLPRIGETLETLGGSRYFTSLDMAHGYFQLIIHPDSVNKTRLFQPPLTKR